MTQDFILLPAPRRLEITGGWFEPQPGGVIALNSLNPPAVYFCAQQLQSDLQALGDLNWEIAAGNGLPIDQIRVELIIVPDGMRHEQGYDLNITPERIQAVAGTPAGLFYAVQTLRQIIQQSDGPLPALRCSDWPDYPHRGVMLDISRDKVPTMETLYDLVDLFAAWKINQLQLYTEHTFAYQRHPLVWAEASPMTGEQILALDDYCSQRFIELVPNQNTFGHMRPWLIHEPYRRLAECPDGCDTRLGRFDQPFSLAPSEPGSLDLVRDLLDELLPYFSSRQVNIGGDEPFDLEFGQGRSAALVSEKGFGRVYLDFLMKIYKEVQERGRSMQFWGDIIMEHPELVPELPRDLIAMEWGYEATHPFDQNGALFAASGVPFYVCPGTSSWRTLAGRTDNAVGNLLNAAQNGLKHGAVGYLITDWGDDGHWQPLPVSYLGFAYGAGLAWCVDQNQELDIARALNVFAFKDKSAVMGKLAFDLGNIYQVPGVLPPNSSVLFAALQVAPEEGIVYLDSLDIDLAQLAEDLRVTLGEIRDVMAPLSKTQIDRPDAALLGREYTWVADMLRHGCWRALWIIGLARGQDDAALKAQLLDRSESLMGEFDLIWHARNRPGGFQDSYARMQKMRAHYVG